MKALLIGSSFSAVPILFDLKRRGMHVTVVGRYRDDPCHYYADSSVFEDYADPENIIQICRKYKFDYIVPSCNDYSYVAAANVSALMGFPGFDNIETTSILHTKDYFRRFCRTLDIPAPRLYGEVTVIEPDLPDGIKGAALVKPVDSFSGRGVQLVRKPSEFRCAIDRAFQMSRRKAAVVEQFVEGALHSHTAFIMEGKVVWHDFVDEFCEVYPYQVDRSIYPSQLPTHLRVAVHKSILKIVSALGLGDGLLHTQFIASQNEFWIIECMRRCPGDLYSHHFNLALGYDYSSQYVASFLGRPPEVPRMRRVGTRIERRVISASTPRAFFGLGIEAEGRKVTFIPLKNSGYRLEAAPFDKVGIAFLENPLSQGSQELAAPRTTIVAHD